MTPSRFSIDRRRWLAFAVLSTIARHSRAAASTGLTWKARLLPSSTPLRQIRAGPDGTLLAVGADGGLWSYATPTSVRKIADGIDSVTPVASGYGRIAARSNDGGLYVRAEGRSWSSPGVGLAANAGLLNLPFAIIGVVTAGRGFRVVRLETIEGRWSESDRSDEDAMPDARPILAALDRPPSESDPGEVVVLAGPDEARYQHGVLGDRIEATRVLWLDRHSLRTLRELALPAPFVFEDIAPRVVITEHGVALLTVRSGGSGTRLALVASDRSDAERLRVIGLGDPLSGPHRWLAPTTDGHRLMAIHTPHIGGVLHEYRVDGERLVPTTLIDDVANHRIGTRELDLAVWRGTTLVVPSQDGRRMRVFEGTQRWTERASIDLPSRVVMTTVLGDPASIAAPFAALLDDGTAYRVERSA